MTKAGQGEDSSNAHDNKATVDHVSSLSGNSGANSIKQESTSASQQMNVFRGDEEMKRDDEDDEAFVVGLERHLYM